MPSCRRLCQAAARHGSMRTSTPTNSHRTRRGGCPHPPVGLWPLRGRVDGDIDPYEAHRKSVPPCRGGLNIRPFLQFCRCLPGRIYNAPLHPRYRICRRAACPHAAASARPLTRTGRCGHRPLQGAPQIRTAPVGAAIMPPAKTPLDCQGEFFYAAFTGGTHRCTPIQR